MRFPATGEYFDCDCGKDAALCGAGIPQTRTVVLRLGGNPIGKA